MSSIRDSDVLETLKREAIARKLPLPPRELWMNDLDYALDVLTTIEDAERRPV